MFGKYWWCGLALLQFSFFTSACATETSDAKTPCLRTGAGYELADYVFNYDAAKLEDAIRDYREPGTKSLAIAEALVFAMHAGNAEAFDILASQGNIANTVYCHKPVVVLAAMLEDPYFLRRVLELGADPNVYDRSRPMYPTPIFAAIISRNRENFELLLNAGADMEFRTDQNSTALLDAAMINHWDVVYILLDLGANSSAMDKWGRDLTFFLNRDNFDPESEQARWREKVIQKLQSTGQDEAK